MQEPQDFRPPTNGSSESERLTLLKSAQTLVTISIIGGPVSLIIGGVLLSTIALICGILAFTKIKRAATPHDTKDALASHDDARDLRSAPERQHGRAARLGGINGRLERQFVIFDLGLTYVGTSWHSVISTAHPNPNSARLPSTFYIID